MEKRIEEILNELNAFSGKSREEIELFRIKFLSKKGIVPCLFSEFKSIPTERKKLLGQQVNQLKNRIHAKIKESLAALEEHAEETSLTDFSLPSDPVGLGTRHPF